MQDKHELKEGWKKSWKEVKIKSETKRELQGKKEKTGRKWDRLVNSEQGFSSAVGVKENATNNEMSILPTSSLSLSLLRLFSSGPHYQCT